MEPFRYVDSRPVSAVPFQSYITPRLRSKWLTYEILAFTYEYIYEVVMLLRALNKQSRTFMDRLIDELRTRFKPIRVISIQPNIKMEGAKMREDRDARQNRALRAYSRLMKIEDFQGMVQLSLGI